MRNCPTCEGPMIWSDDHRRVWCAVYGDHREPVAPTPIQLRPTLVVLADIERRLEAAS